MTKQNKASHIAEGNKMPDEIWKEIFLIPEFEDIEKAHETPWTWCEDDVGDEERPSVKYIRKDLVVPKKEIEGLIKRYKNILYDIKQRQFIAHRNEDFDKSLKLKTKITLTAILIKDLQNLLQSESSSDVCEALGRGEK